MGNLYDIVLYLKDNTDREWWRHSTQTIGFYPTLMVYLFDWKYAITFHKRGTNLRWRLWPHHRPQASVPVNPSIATIMGFFNQIFKGNRYPSLTQEDFYALTHVTRFINKSMEVDVNRLVQSTYPVLTQNRGSYLDLVALAKDYEVFKEIYDRNEEEAE